MVFLEVLGTCFGASSPRRERVPPWTGEGLASPGRNRGRAHSRRGHLLERAARVRRIPTEEFGSLFLEVFFATSQAKYSRTYL